MPLKDRESFFFDKNCYTYIPITLSGTYIMLKKLLFIEKEKATFFNFIVSKYINAIKMSSVRELPNIGKELGTRLENVGISTSEQLIECGSQNAIIKISTYYNGDVCIHMLLALEGAIRGIRWHGLDIETKNELRDFYKSVLK